MGYTLAKKRVAEKPPRLAKDEIITFEKFYEIIPEGVKADLLDGKIIRDSPAIPMHADVASWLLTLLRIFVEQFGLGKVLAAPVTVRLAKYQSPEPDISFINKSRLGVIGESYINGPPDLCVEVISRSSRRIDRGRKFVLYAEHGVKEYWIIDPLPEKVEFFENQNGEWRGILPDEHGRLYSKVLPGFWLKPEWLQGDLPPVLPLLQEMFDAVSSRK